MPTAVLLTFIPYVFIMTFTPGPANIFSLSTSSKYGFRVFLKALAGLFTGFTCDMLLAAAFSYSFSSLLPQATKLLTYVGAVYILWLAWHIFRSTPADANQESHDHQKKEKASFFVGFFLQLCNVKVILYGLTVYSIYIIPYYRSIPVLVIAAPLLALIGASSCTTWALLGRLLQRFLNHYAKISNAVMALILVWCVVEIL